MEEEETANTTSSRPESASATSAPPALAAGPMEVEAARYLREHKIPELLQNLTAELVFSRPEDPRAFMRQHIEQLQKAKSDPAQNPPVLIDDSNVKSVFSMLDLAGKGSVTRQQYLEAMKSLGVSKFNSNPPGAEINKISRDNFVREANAGLKDAATTYLDY